MWKRKFCGDSARHIVLGEILLLRVNDGTIHAINNLILSNIVDLNNDNEMIKPVQQLP